MANIQGYEAPSGIGLSPTETGIESIAGAARRLGAYGNQIADAKNQEGRELASSITDVGQVAVNHMDHREISAGTATSDKIWSNLTQAWEDTKKNADPNDPSVGKKFLEEQVNPALDKFQQGFNTEKSQAFGDAKAETIRQHFMQSTVADMSTLAKIAVTKNLNDSTTAMSNTAITDPTAVPALLKNMDHSVDAILSAHPNISAIDAARVRSEISDQQKKAIVQAGAIGAIQKSGNPEATADEWIKKYPDYISGAEAKTLASNARTQIRARNYDFEVNRRRDKEVAQDKSTEATNQYLIDVRSKDPKIANDPTAVKILNDPTLTKTDKNNLLNYVDRQLKPETDARTSSTTFVNLLRDLRGASDEDADKIMQKAWDARLTDPGKPGSMSEKDFNQFRQEVVARKTPEGAALEHDRNLFFKQYAGAIAGRTYDPVVGSPKLYAAEMDARRVEADLKRKGLDPHLAYDPSSEYFIGNPKRLAKYSGSMTTDLSDKATAPAAAKPEDAGPPASLRGIASLSYSPTRQMYRDDATGKMYRKDGTEVTK